MTAEENIASVAGQLAALTHTVEEMAGELKEVRERAESERERTDIQQERIDLAARELAKGHRLAGLLLPPGGEEATMGFLPEDGSGRG